MLLGDGFVEGSERADRGEMRMRIDCYMLVMVLLLRVRCSTTRVAAAATTRQSAAWPCREPRW